MSEKRSFWATLPGIFTGIAAVITAVSGLIFGLYQVGIIGGEPAPTPVPSPAEFSLTISADGKGTTSPSPGTYTYDKGDLVSIAASPDSDWEFDQWSGDYLGTSPTAIFSVDSDMVIIAHFVALAPAPAPAPAPAKYYMYTQFIVASSDFNSIMDLDGGKIGVKGEDAWQLAEVALNTYGIACQPIYMASSELYMALERGDIDAVLVAYQHPWPPLQGMIYKLRVNLLPWDKKAIQAVTDEFPQMEATALPAGTYSGQEDDIPGYAPR